MAMQIVYSKRAEKQLEEILNYGYLRFGELAAIKMYNDIYRQVNLLKNNPLLGIVEPLLIRSAKNYRSLLVHKHFKIIYYIDGPKIILASFWDVRQNPGNLSKLI